MSERLRSGDLPYLDAGGKRIQRNDFMYGHVLWKQRGDSGMWYFSGLVDRIYRHPSGEIIVGFEHSGRNRDGTYNEGLVRFVSPMVKEVFIGYHERDERT